MRLQKVWPVSVLMAATIVVGTSCSGGGGGGGTGPSKQTGTGTVNVALNDPATCAAPQGPYSHVYLTIADVRANTSATALPTDPGWVDLTPNLSATPVQIDLIGNGALQCTLPLISTGVQVVPAT